MTMEILGLLLTFCVSVFALQSSSTNEKTITVALSPISIDLPKPVAFAVITFDPIQLNAQIISYDNPDATEFLSDDSSNEVKYFKVGIYDVPHDAWISSTSLTSANTFAKGYSPTFILNTDTDGEVISVSVKSHKIDAGQTRDFGPKVRVTKMKAGPRPNLNKPVVLVEGKVEEPVPEKSFLQKYWWVLLAGLMLMVSAGGDTE